MGASVATGVPTVGDSSVDAPGFPGSLVSHTPHNGIATSSQMQAQHLVFVESLGLPFGLPGYTYGTSPLVTNGPSSNKTYGLSPFCQLN